MPSAALQELAADPTLIPGVYKGCDNWCQYCPVPARCLAFRCKPSPDDPDISDPIAVREAAIHIKDCHEAEGLTPPDEILRFLSGRPVHGRALLDKDPLDELGWHYVAFATWYLNSTGLSRQVPEQIPRRPDGPTPFEIFVYYRVLIALKIGRAILSASEAERTHRPEARWDADASAKVALVGIDRSDEALQVMAVDRPDPRLEHMRVHLRALRRAVEARFPHARALVRPGLDE